MNLISRFTHSDDEDSSKLTCACGDQVLWWGAIIEPVEVWMEQHKEHLPTAAPHLEADSRPAPPSTTPDHLQGE